MHSILKVNGYNICFKERENKEPVHVYVCKGDKDIKVLITQMGGTLFENNSILPKTDLYKLEKYIRANVQYICERWLNYFGYITYYC